MSDQEKGLYGKYIVLKKDPVKLVNFAFVLKPETDPAALKALEKYADETNNTHLKADLEQWISDCKVHYEGRRKSNINKLEVPRCEQCGEEMVMYAYNEDGWWLYWDCADEDHIGQDPIDVDWSAIFHPNANVNGVELRGLGFEVV